MRILFVGEAITLSHVVRPLVLARAAAGAGHEVVFAADGRYDAILGAVPGRRVTLRSAFPAAATARRLKEIHPIFSVETLDRYVQEDRRLFRLFDPDLVVGDMRQSLAISARLAKIPYATIMNAHWSPFSDEPMTPASHPLRGFLDRRSFEAVFHNVLYPFGSAYYAHPSNTIHAKYGVPISTYNVRELFTDADFVLYPDVPAIAPTRDAPPAHRYIGPIFWESSSPLPDWWGDAPDDRPVVSVGLGSSGEPDLLHAVIEGLQTLGVTVIVATAARTAIESRPPRLFVADYLPASEAARRADLVVSSGGIMPVQPILLAGRPVLALPSNLDQLITARIVTRMGAGAHVEEESKVTVGAIRSLASRILGDRRYAAAAARLGAALSSMDAADEFVRFLDSLANDGLGDRRERAETDAGRAVAAAS